MGEPVKQVQLSSDDQLVIPDSIKRTQANYKAAQFGYKLDERDISYIEYNTLRYKRLETEERTIIKITRLFDRDAEKEYIMFYQSSRVKDFNNNYVNCPIPELIGVVPKPISNVSNDASNRITDIKIIETQNEYTLPFSKDKLIQLFEVSKERHKIVCYVGYTRPTRIKAHDLLDNKKIIWNQERFVEADFKELMDKDEETQEILDTKKSYIIPNKIREVKQESQSKRVESLADLVKDLNFKPKKKKQEKQQDLSIVDAEKEYLDLQDTKKKQSEEE